MTVECERQSVVSLCGFETVSVFSFLTLFFLLGLLLLSLVVYFSGRAACCRLILRLA